MKAAILAKKLKMTQVFDDNGNIVPCTLLDVTGVKVKDIKTVERDGYSAVVLSKPMNSTSDKLLLKEVKLEDASTLGEKDATVGLSFFEGVKKVHIIGTSKGKGFQGVMKAHNMRGGPATHGQSTKPRSIGSIGPGQTFGRVMKGRRMAKKMGNDRITVKNLRLVKVDAEKNLLFVKGAIPGNTGASVIVYYN